MRNTDVGLLSALPFGSMAVIGIRPGVYPFGSKSNDARGAELKLMGQTMLSQMHEMTLHAT